MPQSGGLKCFSTVAFFYLFMSTIVAISWMVLYNVRGTQYIVVVPVPIIGGNHNEKAVIYGFILNYDGYIKRV